MGMKQYDRLPNGFFVPEFTQKKKQEFSGGELEAWVKKCHGCQTWQYVLLGEFFGGQVPWATLKPSDKKLDLLGTPTSRIFCYCFPPCPTGGSLHVKLNTTCGQSVLPLYYMSYMILKTMIIFLHTHNH